MDKEQIRKLLKGILWDYNIDPFDYYQIAVGNHEPIAFINQEKALLRMFERLTWYELLNLFGMDFIKIHLTSSLTNSMRDKELRKKYEFLRKVLQGEPVSYTGWDTETRERLKSSVLSDRWNRF